MCRINGCPKPGLIEDMCRPHYDASLISALRMQNHHYETIKKMCDSGHGQDINVDKFFLQDEITIRRLLKDVGLDEDKIDELIIETKNLR